jgi:hypothetical protein
MLADNLIKEVPEELKKFVKIYDIRHLSYCSDNIVFVIDKSN